jgi:hypothetical protein
MELAFILVSLVVLSATIWARRKARRIGRRAFRTVLILGLYAVRVVGALALAFGGYRFWFNHRTPPGNANEALFEGVHYEREVRRGKRIQIIHDGATLEELGEVILAHGGFAALNLDGGGSSELVRQEGVGSAKILNSPIHHPLFGPERPIGNHLGVFARPNAVVSSQ